MTKMNDSLIHKLEAKKDGWPSDSPYCQAIDDAIYLFCTHKPAPAPDVVERVAQAIALDLGLTGTIITEWMRDLAKAAIAAMGDASTRKDEGAGETLSALQTSPATVEPSEISVIERVKALPILKAPLLGSMFTECVERYPLLDLLESARSTEPVSVKELLDKHEIVEVPEHLRRKP